MFVNKQYFVYIMASASGTIYIGVTNNLVRRVNEHKEGKIEGFTKKYQCHKLIYYEIYAYVSMALAREKELKKWNRQKKSDLMVKMNPHWNDLYDGLI